MPAPMFANVLSNGTIPDDSTGDEFATTFMVIPDTTDLMSNEDGHGDRTGVFGMMPPESFLDSTLGILVLVFVAAMILTFFAWTLYRCALQKRRRGYANVGMLDEETEQEDDRVLMLGQASWRQL